MDALQIALVALVSVWTLVSLVLGVVVAMGLNKLNAALDRLNEILSSTQAVAQDVRAPVQAVADSVREVFAPSRETPPLPTA
jgi:hypothetical protein